MHSYERESQLKGALPKTRLFKVSVFVCFVTSTILFSQILTAGEVNTTCASESTIVDITSAQNLQRAIHDERICAGIDSAHNVFCGDGLSMVYNSRIWPQKKWFLDGAPLENAVAIFDSSRETIASHTIEFVKTDLIYRVRVTLNSRDGKPLFYDVHRTTVPVFSTEAFIRCRETIKFDPSDNLRLSKPLLGDIQGRFLDISR